MMLKDQALTELNGFNSEDFVRKSESSFDGEMRGEELHNSKHRQPLKMRGQEGG